MGRKGGVSALVLAAGEARRMGRLKQLLPFGSTSLLGRVVENLLASSVLEVVLVMGHEHQRVLRELNLVSINPPKPVKMVVNSRYREGLSSSLRSGLASVDPRAWTMLIALGDQPLIGPSLIDSLIAAFDESDRGIVAPIFRGQRGHPIILDLRYRPEMECIQGDEGCRRILADHPDDLLLVEVNNPWVTWDVDTMEDYQRCLEALEGGG